MPKSHAKPHPERSTFAAEADELSLGDAESARTSGKGKPDSLDVRSDSLMVMEGTLQRLRRPVVAVAVGLAIAVLALATVGVLARARHSGVDLN